MKKQYSIPSLLALILLLSALAGCSKISIFKPYYITIDQGNIFKQEQVDALEIGMTRRQVRFLLGTPSIVDTFNPDQWDYIYTLTRQDTLSIKQHIAIVFAEDKVIEINPIKSS